MKLRYERGALADLDEIFAYIAADDPEAAARLVARIEEAVGGSPLLHTQARRHAKADSDDFRSATI
jgi:plasmid stabilization system protein ParE